MAGNMKRAKSVETIIDAEKIEENGICVVSGQMLQEIRTKEKSTMNQMKRRRRSERLRCVSRGVEEPINCGSLFGCG